MEQRFTQIVSGVFIALAIAVIIIASRGRGDRRAPEITFPDTEAEFEAGTDESAFLEGVTAYDRKDGDVSASLLVESVVVRSDGSSAVVSYVASDSSDNVAKAYRTVKLRKKTAEPDPDGPIPEGAEVQFPDEPKQ